MVKLLGTGISNVHLKQLLTLLCFTLTSVNVNNNLQRH